VTAKEDPETCKILGQTLLLYGMVNKVIDIARTWNSNNKEHREVAYVYITALYVNGEIDRAKKGVEQLEIQIMENSPPEEPKDIIFSLWEQLHNCFTHPRQPDMHFIHTLDYDNLSYLEKIIYNIIHFLIKKQEYTNIHGKNKLISRYLKDFPHKYYMKEIIKRQ
jgi:hypothetical protein